MKYFPIFPNCNYVHIKHTSWYLLTGNFKLSTMIVTIFGATGTVGKELVRHCQAKGYNVKAFGRNVESLIDEDLREENFEAVKGYVFDAGDVLKAIKGSHFVLSALGGDVGGNDKTRSIGMKNIVAQMEKANIKRIVAIGGLGVLNGEDGLLVMDTPSFPKQFKAVSQEHLAALNYLKSSTLDWTFVCPPDILPSSANGRFNTAANVPAKGSQINAGNLALFMVEELSDSSFLKEKVGIANT